MRKYYNPTVVISKPLMVVTGVDPHRFGFPGAFEAAFTVKVDGLGVGHDDVLVEIFVARDEHLHDPRADTAAAVLRKDKEMRVIDDEVAIRNRVAEANEPAVIPGSNKRVGSVESLQEQVRFFGGGPIIRAIESENRLA